MTPKTPRLLALFMASLSSPATRAQTMDEVGSPKDVTRFAHKRNEDGALIVITDTVNGPQSDDAMETISASILVDGKAMLATVQNVTDNIGEISTDEYDMIAQGYAAYLEQDKDVQLSAKGDPELDTAAKIFYFTKTTDEAYTATDVSARMQDYIVDDDEKMAFIYADGKAALIATAQLVENLDAGMVVTDKAVKVIAIGRGKKLARGPRIEVAAGQEVETWAYIELKADGTGFQMVVLAKDNLQELRVTPFNGRYATADRKRKTICVVSHIPADDTGGEAVGGEKKQESFQLTRVPTEKFFEGAMA